MERPSCGTCAYWQRGHHGFADGSCRRRAPSGPVDIARDYVFAPMNSVEWCGEHPSFSSWLVLRSVAEPVVIIDDPPQFG